MNYTKFRDLCSSLSKAGLLYLLVFTYGCSNPTTIENNGITFKNSTTRSLVLSVYDQEFLHKAFVGFRDSIAVDTDSLNVLEPSQGITVFQKDINGLNRSRPANDIGVLITSIKNDSIFYRGQYTFTENQLEKYKHRLIIKEGTNDSLTVAK